MKDEFVCMRCGHRWKARVEKPVECPFCKNYKWDEIKDESIGENKNKKYVNQLNKQEVKS